VEEGIAGMIGVKLDLHLLSSRARGDVFDVIVKL